MTAKRFTKLHGGGGEEGEETGDGEDEGDKEEEGEVGKVET